MSKASELLQKLQQQRENREAIQAYWLELFPERGELKQTQVNAWLIQYDIDTILAGLDAAAIKVNKVDHAVEHGRGDEMTAMRVIKYASMCMRNTGLTDEERQAKDERKAAISKARSEAAHKRWDKAAQVSKDLHQVASVCTDSHRDRFTVTGTDTPTGRDTTTDREKAAPPPVVVPPVKEKEKANRKPTTNPVGGVSANQVKDKTQIKTAKGMQPKPEGFDRWTNDQRLRWIACNCDAQWMCDDPDWIMHKPDCPSHPLKATVAKGAAAAGMAPLGNVDEL